MIRRCTLILCFLPLFVGLLTGQPVLAEENRPTVGVTHWPPWKVVEGDSYGGIDIMILEELGKRLGLGFDFVECPWRRCLEILKTGEVDLISGIAKEIGREEYMIFIEPPYKEKFSSAFYRRKGQPLTIQEYEDLYKFEIGMVRGSVFFDRFDQDPNLRKIEVSNEIQLLKMLSLGRLDLIIGSELNMDYLINVHNFFDKIEKTTFKVDSNTPTYIAISKKSKFVKIIPRIAEALSDMVESNKIQEIEENYVRSFRQN